MKYIQLGKSKTMVSQLGLGCINFGTTTDEKTAFSLIDCYLENGGNILDTANNYAVWNDGRARASEAVLGAYIKANKEIRDKIVLCTKMGALDKSDGEKFSSMQGNGRKTIFEEVEKSLETMNTDYLDF